MMLLSRIKVVMAILLAFGIVTTGALASTQRGTVPPVGGEARTGASDGNIAVAGEESGIRGHCKQ